MSSFKIEKIKTYEQAENFAKFIIKNSEFNSVNDIIKFIKTIKKIIGVVEMSMYKNNTKSCNGEKFTITALLLKLKNNKSIFFQVFTDEEEANFSCEEKSIYIEQFVDFSNEQETREEFYTNKIEYIFTKKKLIDFI